MKSAEGRKRRSKEIQGFLKQNKVKQKRQSLIYKNFPLI